MKVRFWSELPRLPDFSSLESRFPPGTRTGEGSESLRPFLESARKARVGTAAPGSMLERHMAERRRAERRRPEQAATPPDSRI